MIENDFTLRGKINHLSHFPQSSDLIQQVLYHGFNKTFFVLNRIGDLMDIYSVDEVFELLKTYKNHDNQRKRS
ncbi:hypothetical protein V7121_17925 [Neobacillus drentensis]|jgi:hypothetical protein|uniref:hypothetical protein n=1 Tax=Neobacillus drentensis TaxID=220684 RepID=UPI002FFE8DC1